jgi:osmotically-inducible protein OsmY
MNIRTPLLAATTALMLLTAAGCAVTRGQESVGAYIDDSVITTAVKARFVEDKSVDATKNMTEKSTAEMLTRKVNGVKSVRNEIAVRP